MQGNSIGGSKAELDGKKIIDRGLGSSLESALCFVVLCCVVLRG